MDPQQKQEAKYKTKALMGMINDKMAVGSAKLRGEESAALDVAIIKATLQDEVVPKEKHVRTLKLACTASSPRQTVNYVIHGLAKRLEENPKAWLVTLKTLVVFHRLMRETDPSFQEELLRYAERTGHHRMLRLESFADHTTKETWDLSAWIRVYSLYLDERLAVFRTMKFDPEQDQGLENRESKLKSCSSAELLEHLPSVQRLLSRLVSCVPEGAAQANEVALFACSLVLKELRSVYKVVCEGVLNLVDRFFEMDRGDALKGVELVKENLAVNEKLNAFVGSIGAIPPLRGAVQFPSVQPLPADFLTTLEDYVKDAPKTVEAAKASAARAGSGGRTGTATSPALGGTAPRLVVGGPIKDPSSGPTSPDTATPPQPAPMVDLLGGFESLNVSAAGAPPTAAAAPVSAASPAGYPGMPPPSAPAPYPGAPYPGAPPPPAPYSGAPQPPAGPPAAFDPFASFSGAPAGQHPAAQAPAGAPMPPPGGAYPGAPPPYSYGQQAAFPPAPVAAAPPPQQHALPSPQGGPSPSAFSDAAFGAGNAFGVPPAAPPAAQQHAPAAPFNPFANPATHATVAPHMPTPAQGAAPANAFAAAPPPAVPPPAQPPAYQPSPAAPAMPPPPAQQPAPAGFANPFGSPGGAAPAANPFGSPGGAAPSPTNPYGAAPAAQANPFGGPTGAAPAAAGAWAGAQQVVTQQVGGYNLKKPADPLMDLSVDLFGKPQAPATQQPMRAVGAPPNGGGSPGGLF
ncbi:hypothetical protein HYH03_015668 [Edaphochlamys debaryana]|uniref:ENTH domain-containing protein n=1 Tax=Edaphochlamys debaryana TaxID=47281 RepID=A0A836BQY1_9CHLO|nr:hypothetical protein HYH03_015668 [Edaphochlamys debaryana]|eukprot:KAG2485605.1 hypothetical protein HYH03_015668 [Edaphochlamys debaryana]